VHPNSKARTSTATKKAAGSTKKAAGSVSTSSNIKQHIASRSTKLAKLKPAEFIELQKKWYNKLKASGFEDIEWVDHSTGKGQNSDYLKRPDQMRIRAFTHDKQMYYSLCSNYLAHVKIKNTEHRFVFNKHAEGLAYRKIMKLFKARFKKYVSIFYIHYHIHKFKKLMFEWNKTNSEGLLSKEQEPANDAQLIWIP